jgi:hypothetical protein
MDKGGTQTSVAHDADVFRVDPNVVGYRAAALARPLNHPAKFIRQ